MDESFLHRRLEKREAKGLRRELPERGNDLIDFLSNDYLGLSRNRELLNRVEYSWSVLQEKMLGSTGSRLLSGNSSLNEQLECTLSEVFQGQSALLFNSGYNANVGVLSAIPERGDIIFYDELSHACIKDGIRLSLAEGYSFRHNDLNHLVEKLERLKSGGKVFIVTESLFSMDGDFAPIKELVDLADKFGAYLIVDEAHSTGVYGRNGAGWLVENGCEEVFARIYTFGKAIGSHGACVVGSRALTDELINFSRPFIYTTALPPHTLLTLIETFEYLKEHQALLSWTLKDRITYYRSRVVQEGLNTNFDSTSAIQPVAIPGNHDLMSLSKELRSEGFDIMGVRAPTVKEGEERLRVCLHTYNSDEEIDALVGHLRISYSS